MADYLGRNGALEGLRRVRAAGKARHLGFVCRGGDASEVRQLIDTGEFSMINVTYTLLNPSAGSQPPAEMDLEADFGQVITYAAGHGVGVAVYSPLAGGVLTDAALDGEQPHRLSGLAGREVSEPRRLQLARAARLRFLGGEEGGTLAQAALRFVLANPGVTSVLAGASSLAQLEECAAASDLGPLSQDQLAQVEAVWRDNFDLPGRTR
jgi:L-glyceraldehyde 3-phosphate reductase